VWALALGPYFILGEEMSPKKKKGDQSVVERYGDLVNACEKKKKKGQNRELLSGKEKPSS